MRRRLLPTFALASACVSWVPAAYGDSGAVVPEGSIDAGELRAWLMRIHEAASHRNFQGTFVVSAGGVVSSAHIAHYCDGSNQLERIENLDGVPRQVYRRNDVVYTLWPQTRVAIVEQRDAMRTFPALLRGGDDRIADSYELRKPVPGRVAGRDADVLEFTPRDNKRYGYRVWSDQRTGLLLRAEVIGAGREVLESSAFSDVTIGVKTQPAAIIGPINRLDTYKVLRPVLTHTDLANEGWSLEVPVRGFRQVNCVKRPLSGAEGAEGAPQVVQAIYSDGLTHLSVFIERYDEQRHGKPASGAFGATHSLTEQRNEKWVTIVGDAPMETLRSFAQALKPTR